MLCSDIDCLGFGMDLIFGPMSVHIIRPVREQPDTGYWKSLLPYFAAAPGFWGGCGDGVVCFGGFVYLLEAYREGVLEGERIVALAKIVALTGMFLMKQT